VTARDIVDRREEKSMLDPGGKARRKNTARNIKTYVGEQY
jgi:hypothetical protein